MKKIVHIINRIVNSGPENVAKMLATVDNSDIIVTDTWSESHEKVKELLKNDDVIFVTHALKPDIFGMLYIPKDKRISYIHCNFKEDYSMKYGKIKGFLLSMGHNLIISTNKFRVFVSNNAKNATLLKKNNDKVIYNGVNPPNTLVPEGKNSKIFWVGSFINRKNPNLFLEAMEKLLDKNIFSLNSIFMYGNHSDWSLEKFNTKYISILKGFCDDAWSDANINDILVVTSKSEGSPLVVLEAIVRGMKCVIPNLECFREIEKHPNIIYYRAEDVEDLCNKIEIAKEQEYIQYDDEFLNSKSTKDMIKNFLSYINEVENG